MRQGCQFFVKIRMWVIQEDNVIIRAKLNFTPNNLDRDNTPVPDAGCCLFIQLNVAADVNVGSLFLHANYFMAARYSRTTGQIAAAAWAFAWGLPPPSSISIERCAYGKLIKCPAPGLMICL
jgi:hypothetical protein